MLSGSVHSLASTLLIFLLKLLFFFSFSIVIEK